MTTNEMTAAEHAQTALDFLAASDREFAAGDHLQGSEKLYGAATQAVIAICQQRGWRYHSHRDMKNAVTNLAREQDDAGITGGFIAAENFHRNFFHDYMEDYEMDADRPVVHHFVHRLLTLTRTHFAQTRHCERSVAISSPQEAPLHSAGSPRRLAPRDDKLGTREAADAAARRRR